jgi:RNA polymerase sigma-70 factor (ECF subfamily)
MTTEQDEARLIELSRRGDLDAFNEIVTIYQQQVFNLSLRMLGSPTSAEDVTQEAFMSAFRNMSKMRGPSVKSWLLRIASNACIDELRRRRRQATLSIDYHRPGDDESKPAFELPDKAAGPEAHALQSELGYALQAELLKLPSDQRLAVILCDVEQLSYEEIAEAMGTSVGTVKSRISRGRARLREAIEAQPELFGQPVRHTSEVIKGG